jgi:hypothetical protein
LTRFAQVRPRNLRERFFDGTARTLSQSEARKKALTPAQYRSPLGRRPDDLRHAAVSLWLNSGVPATEVARRAGHGVAVLLKIYAHCIDGQADAANNRITDALGTTEPQAPALAAGPRPWPSRPRNPGRITDGGGPQTSPRSVTGLDSGPVAGCHLGDGGAVLGTQGFSMDVWACQCRVCSRQTSWASW